MAEKATKTLEELVLSDEGLLAEASNDEEETSLEELEEHFFDEPGPELPEELTEDEDCQQFIPVPVQTAVPMLQFHQLLSSPSPKGELARGIMRMVECMHRDDLEGLSEAHTSFQSMVEELKHVNQHEDERSELQQLATNTRLRLPLVLRLQHADA